MHYYDIYIDLPMFSTIVTIFSAPESVKKIFSIEYGERKDLTEKWKNLIVESVMPNEIDAVQHHSIEAQSMLILYMPFR